MSIPLGIAFGSLWLMVDVVRSSENLALPIYLPLYRKDVSDESSAKSISLRYGVLVLGLAELQNEAERIKVAVSVVDRDRPERVPVLHERMSPSLFARPQNKGKCKRKSDCERSILIS